MALTRINIIAAVGENRALGKDNKLLWHLKSDLARFKIITLKHPVIMGRKTFESIGKPLPERTNIIITRNKDFKAPGCFVTNSLENALEKAGEIDSGAFIIGGGEIYKKAMPLANRLYLTLVKDSPEADTFFPDWSDFKTVIEKEEGFDEKTGIKFTWLTLEK